VHTNLLSVFKNCAALCVVPGYSPEQLRDIVDGVTGWGLSLEDLERVGERAMDMARVFNAREGMTGRDDWTAPRFLTGFASGPRKGQHIDAEELKKSKLAYYEKMDWDPRLGVPRPGRLEELGIGWVTDHLPANLEVR